MIYLKYILHKQKNRRHDLKTIAPHQVDFIIEQTSVIFRKDGNHLKFSLERSIYLKIRCETFTISLIHHACKNICHLSSIEEISFANVRFRRSISEHQAEKTIRRNHSRLRRNIRTHTLTHCGTSSRKRDACRTRHPSYI